MTSVTSTKSPVCVIEAVMRAAQADKISWAGIGRD